METSNGLDSDIRGQAWYLERAFVVLWVQELNIGESRSTVTVTFVKYWRQYKRDRAGI